MFVSNSLNLSTSHVEKNYGYEEKILEEEDS